MCDQFFDVYLIIFKKCIREVYGQNIGVHKVVSKNK